MFRGINIILLCTKTQKRDLKDHFIEYFLTTEHTENTEMAELIFEEESYRIRAAVFENNSLKTPSVYSVYSVV